MTNQKLIIKTGFKRSLVYTIVYLSIIVLIPLLGLLGKGLEIGWSGYSAILQDDRILSAFYVSFSSAFLASLVDLFFGLVLAWTIVRYDFFGKEVLNTLIDLPLTLPTAVAGISLTVVYSKASFIGSFFQKFGIKLVHNYYGILIALIFIGIPFVVRTVQPVIMEIHKDDEEASELLGATPWQTFRYVIFPNLRPALVMGFGLAFSRNLGEFGSVIFISGNLPYQTEILPLIIVTKLEQYQFGEATAVASLMLLVSLTIMISINYFKKRNSGSER